MGEPSVRVGSQSKHWVFVVHSFLTILAKVVILLVERVVSNTDDWADSTAVTSESCMDNLVLSWFRSLFWSLRPSKRQLPV